jgi:class 3 adenylate cyclase/tetratricopeptide (TPR) repeat protein
VAGGTSRRERKVVTVVFCDLVGFTARAESMDPEDVEALLRPYHERVRSELERHGGTVEKFIGDAVMALFGAPTAHEDDPERAVRAALAIREFALEEELELRVGVTTGEALVRLDVQPETGEGMASGDVVNTAARLQSAAPVNGILVDDTTYRATRAAIDYEDAQAVEAKGKADPVPVWVATVAHARLGVDTVHEARSELVGRARELGIVRDTFERARHERTPQLLTLVGVPGIGKSRLVYELSRIVDADPEIITWRQGRCLAYGDGITLWALGEIVKAQVGVVEQDSTDDIAAKVHQSVEDTLAGTGDESRVESHLLALLVLAGEAQLGGDRHNEAFAAWRRYLEGLAEQRPLVLVVEDIHWADESLLDFLDELVDWLTDVPLLVVATARPELLERRPNWGGGKLNATTFALSPLTDEQTAELIARLLARPVLAAESQQSLLDRAGGNPLYAEQFVELYVEYGSTDELGLPETLQGIIAARLDGLSAAEKGLLQDAAVVGKVFWASSIGRDPADASAFLHSLERKGFVRRQRRSSLEGESEFAFAHALVRDVSYGQIPRADRARRHGAVAQWIEALGRPEDHAEMLAYHWRSALELVRASGSDDEGLAEKTRVTLRDAGDRAYALNSFKAAAAHYEDAVELWPDDTERPDLLFRLARALYEANDGRREQSLETARDALLEVGETDRAAELQALLALVSWYRGQGELTRDRVSRAEELAGTSVSASAARVLAVSARTREIAGDREGGKRLGESALAMAESLGLDELAAHALTTIGMVKLGLGDRTGVADIERAFDVALEVGTPLAATVASNLAIQFMFDGNLQRAGELWAESLRLAERFGDEASRVFFSSTSLWLAFAEGRWEHALEGADAFIKECETGSPHTNEWLVRTVRGSIREARSDVEGALADHLRSVQIAREIQNPIYLAETLTNCAATLAGQGEREQALVMLREVVDVTCEHGMCSGLAICGVFADELGITDSLRAAVEQAPGPEFRGWQDAFLLVLAGDLRSAADRFAAMGNTAFEARQRLHAGERLLALGQRAAGDVELEKALDFYRSVGATLFVERAKALLANAQRDSA